MSAPATAGASQPLRALALLGACLAGWTAARLPAAIESHGLLTKTLTSAAAPVAAALPAPTGAQPVLAQAQPAYLPVLTGAPIASPPPQIIHVHYHTTAANAPPPLLAASAAEWPDAREFAAGQPASPLPVMLSPPQSTPPSAGAGQLATEAYTRLRVGDRRQALRLFEAAMAADQDAADPRSVQWQREAAALKRRWSLSAFTLVRAGTPGADPGAGLATGPLLGASQAGGALGYTLDPLARRRITLSARMNAATDAGGRTDPRTAQAAVGVRYQLLPALEVTAERLVSLGDLARDDWLLRLSSGVTRQRRLGGVSVNLDAYGEASVLGNGDMLAAGQARALAPLFNRKGVAVAAGLGGWGSVQDTGGSTVGRLDLGPSAAVRVQQGRLGLELSADYRQRIAGSALPASGPAVTLSSSF